MSMTVLDSLVTFLRECVARFDPDIDTGTASRFYQTVLSPLLARLGPDPTETDAAQLIQDRLLFYDPELDISPGSGIYDTFIGPLSTVLEPYRQISRLMLLRQSWENAGLMTEEEGDRLASNTFFSRDPGDRASGTIRLLFGVPSSKTISPANVAFAGSLRFVPVRTQVISVAVMATQVVNGYYFMDVALIAEKPGKEYEIAANSITRIDGVSGHIGIQQPKKFTGGRARQDNLALKEAAELSLTVRNLVSQKSLKAVLPDVRHFPGLSNALGVVGRGHPLMERDVLRGPFSVGGIPQGIRGGTNPSLGIPGTVHLGGFTDVWAAPAVLDDDIEETLDIVNIFDEGVLVFLSETGVFSPNGSGNLFDSYAFFTEEDGAYLPIEEGDIVYLQGVLDGEFHEEFVVDDVDDQELGFSTSIPAGEGSYEVRRRIPGIISISLDTLAAEVDGEVVLDNDGNPLLPVPGRTHAAEEEASDRNIATQNISLPLFRIKQVELLDPVSDQPSGVLVPEADAVVFYIQDRVSSTEVLIRALFRLPTRFSPLTYILDIGGSPITPKTNARFFSLDETRVYKPTFLFDPGTPTGISTTVVQTSIPFGTPFSDNYPGRIPRAGDFMVLTGGDESFSMILSVTNSGGNMRFTLEDAIVAVPGTYDGAFVLQGTVASDMDVQEDTELYYFDFIAQRIVGSAESLGETVSAPTGTLFAQGWRLVPRLEGYSFSTLEDVILQISEKINDDVDLTVGSVGIRVTYLTTPLIAQMQTFVDGDEERLVGEDVLVRRKPPALVHLALHYKPDAVTSTPDANTATAALVDAVNSGEIMNATALSNVLEALGAREVVYPFATVVECEGRSRSGKSSSGRLLSYRSQNGMVLPSASEVLVLFHALSQFRAGKVVAIQDAD